MKLYMNTFIIAFIFFILGALIAYFIKYKSIEWHAPSSSEVRKKIFLDENNKRYKLKPIVHICPIEISMNK